MVGLIAACFLKKDQLSPDDTYKLSGFLSRPSKNGGDYDFCRRIRRATRYIYKIGPLINSEIKEQIIEGFGEYKKPAQPIELLQHILIFLELDVDEYLGKFKYNSGWSRLLNAINSKAKEIEHY